MKRTGDEGEHDELGTPVAGGDGSHAPAAVGGQTAETGARWYQPGGPQVSPHIRAQLQQRRERFAASWRRDPGRELALLVLMGVGLATILALGVTWKQRWFDLSGQGPESTYWMESAQRFRYVREVAEGRWIPPVDVRMQAPDGYVPWSDTVLQEVLYGSLFRRFAGPDDLLAPFVRLTTRLVSASAVVPVALLCFGITRRRDAALLGALAWAVALPVAERGTGTVLFREDLAVPVLLWHLGFLAVWSRRQRLPAALLSGVFLALGLLLWKVLTFYVLMLVALLAAAHWLGRERDRTLLLGAIALFAPVVGACFLPYNLHYDRFSTSTPMLLAGSVLVGLLLSTVDSALRARRKQLPRRPVVWALAVLAVFVAARVLLPAEAGYDHAWETILAKLRHFGVKPADPTALSFHARHYWTGNYESPTPALLARDWPVLAALAVPGLLFVLRQLIPRRAGAERDDEAERIPPPLPTRLLEGFGPMGPLAGMGLLFVVWLLGSFGAIYLLFRKFQLLAAVPLTLLVAIGFAAPRGVRRRPTRALLLVGVGLLAAQGWGATPDLGEVLHVPPRSDPDAWNPVVVYPASSFDELARELPGKVGEDEPVLASFVVSPFILAYLDRPTVLHCFFEGDVLERYRRVTEARFAGEEQLWEVARGYGAKWYLHEAHHTLRTDGRMSQRYVAAAMDWPSDSALVRMQYAPEELEHFELAWQNGWFRLFRVLDEGERPGRVRADVTAAIWNRRLFASLFGDPLAPVDADAGAPLEPSDLLYSTLWAERSLREARFAPQDGRVGTPHSERALQEALRVAPYLWEAEATLADYYRLRQRSDRASEHAARAREVKAAMAGRSAMPERLRPTRIPLQGGR